MFLSINKVQGKEWQSHSFLDKKRGDFVENIVQKIEAIVNPIAKELELSLVDVEYLQEGGYWYVRVYVEKLEGDVSLEDCANLSGKIEDEIDALIDKRFFLEVSSPGIERPLKKEADFLRFTGEKIFVALKHKLDEKKNLEGILKSYENQILTLEVEGENISIPFSEVRKAHLIFDFGEF